jgi:myo-inositol-1(or 4)-monophosphatase
VSAHERWLEVALQAAEAAGALLRERWRQVHTIRWKGFRDIVTETDTAVEALILARLRGAFPDHAITSEEAGADAEGAGVRWLIDPLDGTTNFARNNPNFGVSIAALEDGVAVVGAVVDPLRGHIFAAHRGGGATLNGAPIHTSGVTDLEAMIFSVDCPRDPARRQEMWRKARILLTYGRTMRALGAAALNMVYVAAGWTDLYVSPDVQPWDHAAAGLIVQEAGGATGALSGAPWTPFCFDPVMASTPALLAAVHALLHAASQQG